MKHDIKQTDDGKFIFTSPEPFQFEFGGQIAPLTLIYETHGTLSPQKDNAILIHHSLTPSCHIRSHTQDKSPGWWENMVGPGCPIDTNRYYVICINNLGSCFGSSSPISNNPETGTTYRADFPIYTMNDIVKSQYLLLQALQLEKLHAVVGSSMGAMLSLTWAVMYPDSINKLVSISSCHKAFPANVANRAVQRDIIQLDPAWQQGHYDNNPIQGLKTARKLGHFTYRNPQNLNEKFSGDSKTNPNDKYEIENYLDHNANKFAENFDANCYLRILSAMDLYDIARGFESTTSALQRINAEALVISVDSDILFTPEQQDAMISELKQAGVNTQYIQYQSTYGHDTFFVETEKMGRYITEFIDRD